MTRGVYRICNRVNGHSYIGSSVNIEKRFRDHLWELRRREHDNYHLQNAFNKWGETEFRFEILEVTGDQVAREQFCIDVLKPEYNICPLATSTLGTKRSAETCRRYSELRRGKNTGPKSEEHRRKIGDAQRGRPFTEEHLVNLRTAVKKRKGHPHSAETRAKMSAAQKGKPKSEEQRRKMSEVQKGKPRTEAQRRANEARKGKPLTDAQRKYHESRRGKPISKKRVEVEIIP